MSEFPGYFWVLFNGAVVVLLVLDLFVFHRKDHVIKFKEAVLWSLFWISLAVGFNVWIYLTHGRQPALEFAAGYLLELSLSVDNLFVFILIFSAFCVPPDSHYKVLFWGILGAVIMRFLFIMFGLALIEKFHWVIYFFAAILIFSGAKLFFEKEKKLDPSKNIALRIFKRIMPTTHEFHGHKFFIKQGAKLLATPLFVVLIVIETTDVIFALDSIPAIIAVTRDPFIVYTSNIFAILGLRSMYFALEHLMKLFEYLHYGLGAILIFVGAKMVISEFYHVPIGVSLGVIFTLIAASIIASILLIKKRGETIVEPHAMPPDCKL